MNEYYESETRYGEEQRVEPGDERTAAIEIATSWELPYLDDEALAIDGESTARVGAAAALTARAPRQHHPKELR